MATDEVIKDCNTCRFHVQLGSTPPPPEYLAARRRWIEQQMKCAVCVEKADLPYWQQDEALAVESKS